jgi:GNAT superfamily N-acetyltransferase
MKLLLRVMIAPDVPDIRSIDECSSPAALPETKLRRYLKFGNNAARVGIVAECRDPGLWEYAPVGFALYTVKRGRMVLDRLAVHPHQRRKGVGRQLLADVQRRTLTHCVPKVVCTVPESEFHALVFARACGVPPVRIIRGRFGDEDGIKFAMPGGFRPAPVAGIV